MIYLATGVVFVIIVFLTIINVKTARKLQSVTEENDELIIINDVKDQQISFAHQQLSHAEEMLIEIAVENNDLDAVVNSFNSLFTPDDSLPN